MITRVFPAGQGIDFAVSITEDQGQVTIPNFDFTENGHVHHVQGATFTLDVGDVVYITPGGLALVHDGEYPTSLFSTGVAYWLIANVNGELIKLEVA